MGVIGVELDEVGTDIEPEVIMERCVGMALPKGVFAKDDEVGRWDTRSYQMIDEDSGGIAVTDDADWVMLRVVFHVLSSRCFAGLVFGGRKILPMIISEAFFVSGVAMSDSTDDNSVVSCGVSCF